MEPIRAIHYVDAWLPLTEGWIYHQLLNLPEAVENHVVCRTLENLDQFDIPRIHALEERPFLEQYLDRGLRFLGIRRHPGLLRQRLRELRPQILHSHFGQVGWGNLGAMAGTPARHVVTFYGQDVSWRPKAMPYWRARYLELFREAQLFLCEGPFLANELAGLGCPKSKIRVHHLGVELERIPFRPRRWQPPETLRVLMAASFREKKGIPYGLEALGRLRRELPLTVTVVGDANRQPGSQREKGRILAALREADLEPVTRFLGFQPHHVMMEEAYKSHIFLAPSVTAADGDAEGGAPVAIIEMAASGMPIVSTRHCDIPEVVRDGVNAVLVPERDVDGLAEAMRSLLAAHEEWSVRLREGRSHVERGFDASTQGQALGEIYRGLVEEG